MISEEQLKLLFEELKRDEGCKLTAYPDTKKIVTVGIGWNCQANDTTPLIGRHISKVGQRITNEECLKLFNWSLEHVAIKPIEKNLSTLFASLSDIRKRALINLCFNMGINTLLTFRPTLYHMQYKQFNDVAFHLEHTAWYRQVGNRAKRVVHMFKYNDTAFPPEYAQNRPALKKK